MNLRPCVCDTTPIAIVVCDVNAPHSNYNPLFISRSNVLKSLIPWKFNLKLLLIIVAIANPIAKILE